MWLPSFFFSLPCIVLSTRYISFSDKRRRRRSNRTMCFAALLLCIPRNTYTCILMRRRTERDAGRGRVGLDSTLTVRVRRRWRCGDVLMDYEEWKTVASTVYSATIQTGSSSPARLIFWFIWSNFFFFFFSKPDEEPSCAFVFPQVCIWCVWCGVCLCEMVWLLRRENDEIMCEKSSTGVGRISMLGWGWFWMKIGENDRYEGFEGEIADDEEF